MITSFTNTNDTERYIIRNDLRNPLKSNTEKISAIVTLELRTAQQLQ